MNVPSPLPSKIVALAVEKLVTTRSANPSPSKSPTATPLTEPPTTIGEPVASSKFPSPSPSKIETSPVLLSRTIRSEMSLPVRSATSIRPSRLPAMIGD